MSQPPPPPFAAPPRLSTLQLRQRVAIRTVALAALAGRAPQNVNQSDYEQAKRDVANEFASDQARPPAPPLEPPRPTPLPFSPVIPPPTPRPAARCAMALINSS